MPKKCKALIIPWQFKRGFVVGAGKVGEVGSESERTKDLTRTFIFFRTIIRIHLNEKGMKGKLSWKAMNESLMLEMFYKVEIKECVKWEDLGRHSKKQFWAAINDKANNMINYQNWRGKVCLGKLYEDIKEYYKHKLQIPWTVVTDGEWDTCRFLCDTRLWQPRLGHVEEGWETGKDYIGKKEQWCRKVNDLGNEEFEVTVVQDAQVIYACFD